MPTLKPEQVTKLKEQVRNGMTLARLAREHGISRPAVYNYAPEEITGRRVAARI